MKGYLLSPIPSVTLMLRHPYAFGLASLAALLVIAGCNVLDAAYQEGGSVENLIEDAYYARVNEDFDHSEELLREAFDLAPDHPKVRLDLASTLMQGAEINLLDLEAVTTHLLTEIETETGQGRGTPGDTCTWTSDEATRPFDPRVAEGYEDLVATAPVITEVLRLLNDPATPTSQPVLPAGLSELDPCSVVDGGTLSYDRDALLGTLYDHFGRDDLRINTALTINAVALTLGAYLGIFESPDLTVDWFLIGEAGDARIGFCTDRASLVTFEEEVDTHLDAIAQTYFSLDLLLYNGGSTELRTYLNDALDFYSTLEASFDGFCER